MSFVPGTVFTYLHIQVDILVTIIPFTPHTPTSSLLTPQPPPHSSHSNLPLTHHTPTSPSLLTPQPHLPFTLPTPSPSLLTLLPLPSSPSSTHPTFLHFLHTPHPLTPPTHHTLSFFPLTSTLPWSAPNIVCVHGRVDLETAITSIQKQPLRCWDRAITKGLKLTLTTPTTIPMLTLATPTAIPMLTLATPMLALTTPPHPAHMLLSD